MAIGNWGPDVIFSVSDAKVFTLSEINHSVGSDWSTHGRICLKDEAEFLRPKLQELTFTIILDASLGVKPRATLEILEEAAETGRVETFVLGGKRVGKFKWRITDLSESWDFLLNGGELVQAKVNVTMEEYV